MVYAPPRPNREADRRRRVAAQDLLRRRSNARKMASMVGAPVGTSKAQTR